MKKMQVSANNGIETADKNLIQQFFFRYWPYWPLFAFLMICGVGVAYLYLRTTVPMYESTATILIKDEKKGLDDSKVMESLNPLNSKKIVENETEIIRSRTIVTEVVKELALYAPIFEKTGFAAKSAYATCPVSLELSSPDSLTETPHVDFTYSPTTNLVTVNKTDYPVNLWSKTPWGIARFKSNPLYKDTTAKNHSYYFTLVSVSKKAKSLSDIIDVSPVSKLSTVITLKIRDESPERGEAILNNLMFVYNKVSIADKTQLASNTLGFVEKRLKLIEAQLDSA
ncbi:Wzz/FepE/Etk N-terminal domain-containing protein, partial [Mucilaginibacter sp.]|uniref:Wzz/FepE/Etk N-terminal domain-containing protein n=1 Tax=Mucilaginibacter sp. TaxID=1882438 RepID=UPI0035BC2B35